MSKKDTAGFLARMNARNESIAAREVEAKIQSQRGVDPVREARDAERRERLGQLRARPKPKKKLRHVRSTFGHIDLS
jgi:hypothetical protein